MSIRKQLESMQQTLSTLTRDFGILQNFIFLKYGPEYHQFCEAEIARLADERNLADDGDVGSTMVEMEDKVTQQDLGQALSVFVDVNDFVSRLPGQNEEVGFQYQDPDNAVINGLYNSNSEALEILPHGIPSLQRERHSGIKSTAVKSKKRRRRSSKISEQVPTPEFALMGNMGTNFESLLGQPPSYSVHIGEKGPRSTTQGTNWSPLDINARGSCAQSHATELLNQSNLCTQNKRPKQRKFSLTSCEVCKDSIRRESLPYHIQIHFTQSIANNQREFQCFSCPHVTNDRDEMVLHSRTHVQKVQMPTMLVNYLEECEICQEMVRGDTCADHRNTHFVELSDDPYYRFRCCRCSFRGDEVKMMVEHCQSHTLLEQNAASELITPTGN